jgi:hypothetical protein
MLNHEISTKLISVQTATNAALNECGKPWDPDVEQAIASLSSAIEDLTSIVMHLLVDNNGR